jgi:hypothetical protein
MTWWHAAIIFVAGLWAGTINAVVGSGTLVTFPVLVALGYPPVTATTSNALGLIPGTIAGAIGYRKELTGRWRWLIPYTVASFLGAICGAILLLTLPKDAFETVVPALVGLAVILVIAQPKLTRWLAKRREDSTAASTEGDSTAQDPTGQNSSAHSQGGPVLLALVFAIGIYGGYFTAAQGVMLMAVLGIAINAPIQRLNATKNVLTAVVNVVAGTIYAFTAPVQWPVIGILALSSTIGGFLGAKIGLRLPATVLRAVIVIIGLAAVVQLILK